MARAGGLSGAILHAITSTNESFEQATRRLLRLAELSHGARDYDALEEISRTLEAIPFAPAQNAAVYYRALVMKRAGHLDTAADLLATLAAPRAIHTLGTVYKAKDDWANAAQLYVKALHHARNVDPLTVINASIELATVKSIAGEHHAALADLENLWPMVRTLARRWPHLFFQLHNELAVELAAVGRVEAARQACAVAVSAPVADCYPEWRETQAEIAEPERVAVAVAVLISKQQVTVRTVAPGRALLWLVISHQSLVVSHWSLVTCHLSLVIRLARAPDIIERVKLCARDRDGPFVNPSGSQGTNRPRAEPGTHRQGMYPAHFPRAPKRATESNTMATRKATKAKTPANNQTSAVAATAKKQSFNNRFDLDKLESLQLGLVDRKDGEIIIELDRITEEKPQLKIMRYEGGDLKSCYTIHDIDA